MSRVVADVADLERVARQLDDAAAELTRVAEQVIALAGTLPVPVAPLLLDVSAPVERGLTAEAGGVRVLAGELRLVGHAIERAMAGGIDPRLAVDSTDWLRKLERRRGGPPPLWPLGFVPPLVREPRSPASGGRQLPAVTGQPRRGNASGAGAVLVVLGGLLALWALSQAQTGGSNGGSNTPRNQEDLHRQQKQKAVSQALAGAPKPPLRPEDENEIERNARELNVDRARFESLARDPGSGWKIDRGSIEEARIAIRLERSGQLHDVVRSPDPQADFIEDGGAGRDWDVKSPRAFNFDAKVTMNDIGTELGAGNNVVINTTYLDADQASEIQQAVNARGWSGRVILTSSE